MNKKNLIAILLLICVLVFVGGSNVYAQNSDEPRQPIPGDDDYPSGIPPNPFNDPDPDEDPGGPPPTDDEGGDDDSALEDGAGNLNPQGTGPTGPTGCGGGLGNNFKCAVGFIISLLNAIIPLLIGIAVVLFLFGLIKYITAGGDESKIKEARNFIIFGVVGIFVMVSVWGLVHILVNTFFPDGGMYIPQVKG